MKVIASDVFVEEAIVELSFSMDKTYPFYHKNTKHGECFIKQSILLHYTYQRKKIM